MTFSYSAVCQFDSAEWHAKIVNAVRNEKDKLKTYPEWVGVVSIAGSPYGNEFMFGWRSAGIISLGVQNHFTNIPLSSGYNMEALWTNWHKHCFTWRASGSVKVFFLYYSLTDDVVFEPVWVVSLFRFLYK